MTTYDEAHFASLACSGNVTWSNDIKKLFTQDDINCMNNQRIDLSKYDDVKKWATKIYQKVANGSMPPQADRRWPPERVNTFGCWIKQGCPQ
ncbi:hypothetical protein [Burkholderia ubonensis]|uniref:hypothetical protein n=1 Tax=Burkholderia ubonensis TaxID=101571 RepID=UPI0007529774|nr:hypothetical protein [Burkholderia ubonensis]KVG87086.1 hypothetical protein WJ36_32855 [Burkholderia ubonensis]KVR17484.1 hypothetical protein WK12_03720 [Burkholderia ubonensis]KVU41210.1 hypothetical protein WK68_12820 [Burkholderia ubonensis]